MCNGVISNGTGVVALRQAKSSTIPALGLLRPVSLALAAMVLAGCDPRDCALGIAHRDCYAEGSTLAAFPQDDAICRGQGLEPGTRDYAICRRAKQHVRALTERETDYGVLRNPLIPDVTVVTPVPPEPR